MRIIATVILLASLHAQAAPTEARPVFLQLPKFHDQGNDPEIYLGLWCPKQRCQGISANILIEQSDGTRTVKQNVPLIHQKSPFGQIKGTLARDRAKTPEWSGRILSSDVVRELKKEHPLLTRAIAYNFTYCLGNRCFPSQPPESGHCTDQIKADKGVIGTAMRGGEDPIYALEWTTQNKNKVQVITKAEVAKATIQSFTGETDLSVQRTSCEDATFRHNPPKNNTLDDSTIEAELVDEFILEG